MAQKCKIHMKRNDNQVVEAEIDYTRVINDKDFIENFSKKVSTAEGQGGDDKPV